MMVMHNVWAFLSISASHGLLPWANSWAPVGRRQGRRREEP